MLNGLLQAGGHKVGRQHVSTPMKKLASRRSTTARTPGSRHQGTRSIRTCSGAWR
jgi:guanyl-specific ribonuclease Sa